ncbi:pyrophosphatase PpaX [Tumebacillus permanentifrigoris]|uniref:Pyrophosphatase PpaX n=1 Tax=Tumebacillus permanentifrigoris TaxID=378543 RepID=A0A316D834_9BACL|nr:pyrophosphatase PpaX [Tumebacillus permanentifrigoris]PWK13003.1 pyrophosphatase PpaX [Tumebacillus permanentifrigoris]
MKYQYVLYDLDGTLLDTNELIIRSFEHTLDLHTPGAYTREHILPQMGAPLFQQMELFAPGRSEELVATYRRYNLEQHDALVTAFPHVVEVLRELHEAGCKQAIVTSKVRLTTEKGLALCGLSPYLDAVVTVDECEHHKPHPEPVLKAMALLGADPASTIMIGDSPFDIGAGQAAGVATAGVKWSLRGEAGLRPHHPDYLVSDMLELRKIILGT